MHAAFRKYLLTALLLCAGILAAQAGGGRHTFTLVIDAGHGGHDAGAVGSFSKEKDINLKVALAFGRLVEENCPEVKVIYTRRRDVFIALQRRADIANEAKADLFISVHTNALPGGRIAYGSETYSLGMARAAANLAVAKRENAVITLESNYQRTYEGFDPNKAESYVIFEIMQDKYMKQSVDLASCIQREYTRAGRPDKGVHQAGFLVLRNTSMPSVLTELGFITTLAEEKYLNSEEGVAQLSRSIYNGFLAYRRQHDKTARDLPADLPLKDGASLPPLSPAAPSDTGGDVAVVPVEAVPSARKAAPERTGGSARTPKAAETPAAKPQPSKSAEKAKGGDKAQSAARQGQKTGGKPAKKEKTEKKGTAASSAEKSKKKPQEKKPRVTYRIQVGAGKKEISPKDPQFKGLAVTRVKEGSFYKFFYGSYSTYAEARKGLRTAQAKLPGAYMVAYIAGKPATVPEARAEEKKK